MFDRTVPVASELPSLLAEMDDSDTAEWLAAAVLDRKNIVLAGATGSAKTTVARSLAAVIPEDERVITIEDNEEFKLRHRNRVSFLYSRGDQGAANVTPLRLLECSLRMRPDRVLMQELSDGAAFAYLRGVVAGHPGCITTIHASSPLGAFDALRLMVRQHPDGKTMEDRDVKEMLAMTVDIVVHCERNPITKRYRVTDTYERGKDDEVLAASFDRHAFARGIPA